MIIISHAKSAKNTDSFLSLTQNPQNTQIFLSERVGSRSCKGRRERGDYHHNANERFGVRTIEYSY